MADRENSPSTSPCNLPDPIMAYEVGTSVWWQMHAIPDVDCNGIEVVLRDAQAAKTMQLRIGRLAAVELALKIVGAIQPQGPQP